MSGHTTIEEAAASEPCYWPVLEIETGRVVGAGLVGAGAPASVAARAFAVGAAAREGWWLGIGPPHGTLVAPTAVTAVWSLLRDSRLEPDRLVLRIAEDDLADAVGSGAAAAVAAMGVRLAVEISLAGLDRGERADVAAVRATGARVASLGGRAVGVDVESDAQLALAHEAGLGLVQGYGWGSPGSLVKLVHTWARQPVSG